MDYLLLGGPANTGKTQMSHLVAQALIQRRFEIKVGNLPNNIEDFLIIVAGSNNLGQTIRVLINSASDTKNEIERLKRFYDDNQPIDYVISSIRDNFGESRSDFFEIMNFNQQTDMRIEIPLASIRYDKDHARRNRVIEQWYLPTLLRLINLTLFNPPFNF